MILPNNINDVKVIINLKLRKYDNLFKPVILETSKNAIY